MQAILHLQWLLLALHWTVFLTYSNLMDLLWLYAVKKQISVRSSRFVTAISKIVEWCCCLINRQARTKRAGLCWTENFESTKGWGSCLPLRVNKFDFLKLIISSATSKTFLFMEASVSADIEKGLYFRVRKLFANDIVHPMVQWSANSIDQLVAYDDLFLSAKREKKTFG